jgi:hypothetical protein
MAESIWVLRESSAWAGGCRAFGWIWIPSIRYIPQWFFAQGALFYIRTHKKTQSVQAGIEQGLTSGMRLRMTYRFQITQRGSLDYANHIAEIGLRFKI